MELKTRKNQGTPAKMPRDGLLDNINSALLDAVREDDNSRALHLLEQGAKPVERDEKGRTVLMHAVMNCNPDLARKLVYAGAEVSAEDNSGKNVLDYCFQYADLKTAGLIKRAERLIFTQ